MKRSFGIDLGGTWIRAAVVEPSGRMGPTAVRPVCKGINPARCADMIIDACAEAAAGLKKPACVEKAGIAAAGQMHPDGKTIVFSPNLKWNNVPLASLLEKRLGVPVFIENDVNAAALGEHRFGAGRGAQNLVCIFVGTGIGGGFIIGGRLYRGASGVAAEIGHMIYKPSGPLCGCGKRGCFEAFAGGANFQRRFEAAARRSRNKRYADKTRATDVCIMAAAGDPLAVRYWNEAETAICVLSSGLVSALNPDVLVIGGSIGLGAPGLVSRVRKFVKERSVESASAAVKIVRAQTGANAGVLGASVLGEEDV
jgi:glucokinase